MREKDQKEFDDEAVDVAKGPAPFRPSDTLAAEILREALPKSAHAAVARRTASVIVLEVPGSNWWGPMASGLKTIFEDASVVRPMTMYGPSKDRSPEVVLGPTFIILGDPGQLPRELLASADIQVSIRPTPRALMRALRALYGSCAQVKPSDFAGLDWPELVVALRPGSTPRQCVARWRAVSEQLAPRSPPIRRRHSSSWPAMARR